MSRRGFVWLLCLCVGLPACGQGPPAPASDPSTVAEYDVTRDALVNPDFIFEPFPDQDPSLADEDTTLTRHLIGEPRTLNPIMAYSWFDYYFLELMFPAMFRRVASMDIKVNSSYVEHYEESDDHLTSTIRLIPGMKWHDGQPFTAHDVRFTWQAIRDERVPAPGYKFSTSHIKDVEVLDDTTLRVHHVSATATSKFNMGFPILPRHIYDNPVERARDPSLSRSDYYNRLNRVAPIGAGPYRFVEWITNDRLVVQRWDDFHAQKPHFRRIVLKIQPDRNMSLLLFKKGQLDEIWLTPQQFATQSNDAEFRRVGVKGTCLRRMIGVIAWNMDGSNPFFHDQRVRQAMCHAYDAEKVLRDVTHGLYYPATGIFDEQHWCYNSEIAPFAYDLDRAAELLDAAGWIVSEDDGFRYQQIDGRRVRFEFELLMASSFADAVKMANIFRDDLRKLGVTLHTRRIENAAFDSRTIAHEFQALASVVEVSTDPDYWHNYLHSSQHTRGRNFFGLKDARVDTLLESTRATLERDQRAEYFREIQARVYQAQPMLTMWNYALLRGFNRRLRGINYSPAGIFLFYPGVSAWWVPRSADI